MPDTSVEINIPADDPQPDVRVLRATVRDLSGQPIADAEVRFAVEGAGSFAPGAPEAITARARTSEHGFAWARWFRPRDAAGSEVQALIRASTETEPAKIDLDHFHHFERIGPYAGTSH